MNTRILALMTLITLAAPVNAAPHPAEPAGPAVLTEQDGQAGPVTATTQAIRGDLACLLTTTRSLTVSVYRVTPHGRTLLYTYPKDLITTEHTACV